MGVAAWQIFIFSGIFTACLIFGSRGLRWATIAACVWTLVQILTAWLFALQFLTILFADASGWRFVNSASYGAWRLRLSRLLLCGGAIAVLAAILIPASAPVISDSRIYSAADARQTAHHPGTQNQAPPVAGSLRPTFSSAWAEKPAHPTRTAFRRRYASRRFSRIAAS
jgi:hypothetical protein